MSASHHDLLSLAQDRIPDALHYQDGETGAREYIVNGQPKLKGSRIEVPIDETVSYGQLQGLIPAWLNLIDSAPGIAYFELNTSAAKAALTN